MDMATKLPPPVHAVPLSPSSRLDYVEGCHAPQAGACDDDGGHARHRLLVMGVVGHAGRLGNEIYTQAKVQLILSLTFDLNRFYYATTRTFTVGGEGLVVDIFVVHTSVIESGFPGVVHVAREFRAAVTKSVTKYENWMRPM